MKLTFFLQTLEEKITTEIQRNVKLLHLLNEKVICLTLTANKIQFSAKKWSISLSISSSKITKMKLQKKELKNNRRGVREEY